MVQPAFKLEGLATAIGSMPHRDPAEAYAAVMTYLPDVPVWPQLPCRSFLENMYAQFSDGFPGIVLDADRIYIDRTEDLTPSLEKLYAAYLERDVDKCGLDPDHASGFHYFLEHGAGSPKAVKGQVTGPISFGLAVTDQDRRPTLYDETLADAIAKHVHLSTAWQERQLGKLCSNTIMFIDEPYLASLGSAFVALSNDTVVKLTNEAVGSIRGLKGMHCCGNTDWSVIMATDINVLNFDAYNYGETLGLYPTELKAFLNRGGVIAWGIVPSDEGLLRKESSANLMTRLGELMSLLVGKGLSRDVLLEQSLITPSCGLGSVSIEAAGRALALTSEVSHQFRARHGLGSGG